MYRNHFERSTVVFIEIDNGTDYIFIKKKLFILF